MALGASNDSRRRAPDVFASDEQRERFLELLDDLAERLVIETHYYCLLANNYHLLLHTTPLPGPRYPVAEIALLR